MLTPLSICQLAIYKHIFGLHISLYMMCVWMLYVCVCAVGDTLGGNMEWWVLYNQSCLHSFIHSGLSEHSFSHVLQQINTEFWHDTLDAAVR